MLVHNQNEKLHMTANSSKQQISRQRSMTNDSQHNSLSGPKTGQSRHTRNNEGLRARKKAETRDAIACAAAELMLEEGSEGTTIASITNRANVSSRTFHNYFPHRDAAFLHFIETYVEDVADWIDHAERGLPPIELLRRLASEIMVNPTSNFPSVHTVATLGEHMSMQMNKEGAKLLIELFSRVTHAIYRYCEGQLSMLEIHLMTNAAISLVGAATEVENKPEYNGGRSLGEIFEMGFDRLEFGFDHTLRSEES